MDIYYKRDTKVLVQCAADKSLRAAVLSASRQLSPPPTLQTVSGPPGVKNNSVEEERDEEEEPKKGPTHRVSSSFCHRQGFMAAGNTALLNFVFLVSFLAAYKAKAGTSEKKALASPLLMLRRAVPCRAVPS